MPQPSARQKRFELASKRQARFPYYILDIMTCTTTPVRKHLFADETGNFDFSRKSGATRYFILASITLRECGTVNARLQELRHQMAWEGHDHPGPFHATKDPAPVRNRVLGIIEDLDLRVDALVLEKAKAMPHIRATEERFYKHAWFYLMRFVLPRLNCRELLVVPASIGNNKRRTAFHDVVREVMQQVGTITYRTACWDANSDACLQVADYCGWALQRKWEMGDMIPYGRIQSKIRSEYDLFAPGRSFTTEGGGKQ